MEPLKNEDVPASFWGKFGLFSGAMFVSCRVGMIELSVGDCQIEVHISGQFHNETESKNGLMYYEGTSSHYRVQ